MHDIWNPWHGCVKKSEGCANCYMYALDSYRGHDGSRIYRTRQGFNYPLQKVRGGGYKVRSGEMIRVCMTSDFFLEEADLWRQEAWNIIRQRPDVVFFLLTKRPERVAGCLPPDWADGWDNVFFNVSCENQRLANERIPILLRLPFKHKGIMCAPLIGPVNIASYLRAGQIEQVLADGENYNGARPCRYEWIKGLSDQCKAEDVTFVFCGTGNVFEKDGITYRIPKGKQAQQAALSGLSYQGKTIKFTLHDSMGFEIDANSLYKPHFRSGKCNLCGMRPICNGCSDCDRCKL